MLYRVVIIVSKIHAAGTPRPDLSKRLELAMERDLWLVRASSTEEVQDDHTKLGTICILCTFARVYCPTLALRTAAAIRGVGCGFMNVQTM